MTADNPETVEEAIESVATGMVKRTIESGRETELLPLKEMIEADRYLAGKRAAAKSRFGLRFTKCIPPGGG